MTRTLILIHKIIIHKKNIEGRIDHVRSSKGSNKRKQTFHDDSSYQRDTKLHAHQEIIDITDSPTSEHSKSTNSDEKSPLAGNLSMEQNDETMAKELQEKEYFNYTLDLLCYINNNENCPPQDDDLAWNFVENVIERYGKIQNSPKASPHVQLISRDDMYDVAKAMFARQKDFLASGLPVEVTLGYHYTHQHCINSISQDGLIVGQRVGYFGKGIYLGNNACAFHGRGPIGLIVAILKGKCLQYSREGGPGNNHPNTIIGNKKN